LKLIQAANQGHSLHLHVTVWPRDATELFVWSCLIDGSENIKH